MELVLVRHGIAEDQTEAGDTQRSLTDQGMQQTGEIARGLARFADPPDAIVHSPKLRAAQTAELFGSAFGIPPQPLEILGGTSVEKICEALAQRRERRLLVVGHEPTLSQLIWGLLNGCIPNQSPIKMGKAGCAMVEVSFAQGQQAAPAKLHWLLAPEALLKIAEDHSIVHEPRTK